MTRGRAGRGRKFGGTKASAEGVVPGKRHYEEFGEAHPIDEKESRVKRLKVEDSRDGSSDYEDEDSDAVSSDEEGAAGDPLSTLLATFNTHTGKAVDSDEEVEDEEEDEEDDDDDEEDEDEEEEWGEVDDGVELSKDENDSGSDESDASDSDQSEDTRVKHLNNKDVGSGKQSGSSDSLENRAKSSYSSDEEDDSADTEGDLFSRHFERNLSESCAEQVKDKAKWTSAFQKWPTLGNIKVQVPKVEIQTSKPLLLAEESEETNPPTIGMIPQHPDLENYSLQNCCIRKNLQDNFAYASNCDMLGYEGCPAKLSNLQKELLCILSSYSDLYYPEASHEHWDEVNIIYTLHAVNHVLKTRKKIMNHNSKLKSRAQKKSETTSGLYRDQGYTRPKVLILLPFKYSAYKVVETIKALLFKGNEKNVLNYNRFKEDFGPSEEETESRNDKLSRPEDFIATFTGNINEDFKIGLKVTKSSLKLYADFYQSDIILASPLGLRYIMGSTTRTDIQSDFLTSVEVLILDKADIFMMQNWEHILVLMDAINKPPRDIHKISTDLTRVRLWSLEGHAPLYRQTLIFSSTPVDYHRALISKCTNFAGKLEVLNPSQGGSVEEVVVHTNLVINKILGVRDPDARFHHFTTELLPRLRSEHRSHTLIYIPDYCDYVRLLRHLKEDGGTSIASINEYMVSQNSKVAKARSLFFDGKRHFLLYTERFHFYRRYRIKGVRHVIFYDLPTYPHFFSEICNLMVEGNQNPRTKRQQQGSSTVTMIVQKSDLTRLVGILGQQRAADILSSEKVVHTCVLGR